MKTVTISKDCKHPETTSEQDAKKHAKGLKGYKKAQKEKILTKRAAAAVKSKLTSNCKTEDCVNTKTNLHEESVIQSGDETGDQSHEIECAPLMQAPVTQEQIKALEIALYDNMESPMEMLARCSPVRSADTEFHVDYNHNLPEGSSTTSSRKNRHATDNEGFEVFANYGASHVKVPNTGSSFSDQLFGKISCNPVMATSKRRTKACQPFKITTRIKPITIDQLFAIAIAENTPIVRSPSSGSASWDNGAPYLHDFENEMIANGHIGSCNDRLSQDPAIVSYRVSSPQNDGPLDKFLDYVLPKEFSPPFAYNTIPPPPFSDHLSGAYVYGDAYNGSNSMCDISLDTQVPYSYDCYYDYASTMPGDGFQPFTPGYTIPSYVPL